MIVASHQPDLLPYSGFWYKMLKADIFDIKIFDQFVAKGYQRRVMMRGSWASVPVIGNPRRDPIVDVRIDPVLARETLTNIVHGRYRTARHFKDRGQQVLDVINGLHTDKLWQFNLDLILGVREILGITTPVAIAVPTVGRGSEGLVSVLRRYPQPVTYLSGIGARAYMGECQEFTEAGISVEWSRHDATTGESILTVLCDYDDPLEIVAREHAPDEPNVLANPIGASL